MTWKSSQLDIYFHMANHYKKLRTVKSVVDTSPPTGYYDKMQSSRQSRPPSRAEKHRPSGSKSVSSAGSSDQPYNDLQGYRKNDIVNNDCLNHAMDPVSRSQSLPPRPPTRRKPVEMPNPNKYVYRARSTGPSNKTNVTSMQKSRSARSQCSAKTTPIFAYFATVTQDQPTQETSHIPDESSTLPPTPAPRNSKTKKRDTSFKNSISDHEYLQFSLRITEDIIRNDLYTNKEMRRVFNSHIEANRGRLNMDKMSQQIENLCRQLNIPLDESQDDDLATRSQIKAQRQIVPSSLACICGPMSRPLNAELKDCECGSKRCLPFQCVKHSFNSIEEDEDNISEKFTNVKPKFTPEHVQNDEKDSAASVSFEEGIIETHYFENPESHSNSNTSLELNSSCCTNELSDFSTEPVVRLRQSLGCIELPSLSRVTERTEPTSNSSLDNHLELSDHHIESISEFDTSEALPGFESLEKSEQLRSICQPLRTSSHPSNKNLPRRISFNETTITGGVRLALSQSKESKPPEFSEKSEVGIPTAVEDVSTNSLNSNAVFWSVCSFDSVKPSEGSKSRDSERNKIVVNVQPLVESVSPQHLSLCLTDRQTKSELVHSSEQSSVPYSMKEYSSGSQQRSLNEKSSVPSTEAKQTIPEETKKRSCVCVNTAKPDFEMLHLTEVSNVTVYGPNNKEEEFVLFPGPIYVPKSSVIPANSREVHNFAIITPQSISEKDAIPLKIDAASFTKDAVVNTDEQMHNISNTMNSLGNIPITNSKSQEERVIVIKDDNTSSFTSAFNSCMRSTSSTPYPLETESATYSQMHNGALRTVHYPSFVSNLSHAPDVTHNSPGLDDQYLTKIMMDGLEKPRAMLKNRYITNATDQRPLSNYIHSSYEYQEPAARIAQLSDYDLTPQRDVTQSISSISTGRQVERKPILCNVPLFNTDSLLLSDEYEIKDNFSKKSSNSSCYDNGLPQSICKFYPNISTQTQSSDWLPTIRSSTTLSKESNIDVEVVKPLNDVVNKSLEDTHNNGKSKPSKNSLYNYEVKLLKDTHNNGKSKLSKNGLHNDEVKPLNDAHKTGKRKPSKNRHHDDEELLEDEHNNGKSKPSKNGLHNNEVKSLNNSLNNGKTKPSKNGNLEDVHNNGKTKPSKNGHHDEELLEDVHKTKPPKRVHHEDEVRPFENEHNNGKTKPSKNVYHDDDDDDEDDGDDVMLKLIDSDDLVDSLKDTVHIVPSNIDEKIIQKQESLRTVEVGEESSVITFSAREASTESIDLSDIFGKDLNDEKNWKEPQGKSKTEDQNDSEVEKETQLQNKGGEQHAETTEESDETDSESNDDDDDDDVDNEEDVETGFYNNLNKDKEKEIIKEKLDASDVAFVTYGTTRPSKTEDEDILSTLDKPPSELLLPRESIMQTVKKVTTDLEKLRHTEIPSDTFVQKKYNIPIQNRKLLIADDLLKDDNPIQQNDERQLPFIQVGQSEVQLPQTTNTSEENYTKCCGLKIIKKKVRNDITSVDESVDSIPNISAIPDDQLYDFDARRFTEGFIVERKSLRFDYSPMAQFDASPENIRLRRSTVDSNYSKTGSLATSDDYLPSRGQSTVNHDRKPSAEAEQHDSVVSFNEHVKTINGSPRNLVVEILRPPGNSIDSIENGTADRKRKIKTSFDSDK